MEFILGLFRNVLSTVKKNVINIQINLKINYVKLSIWNLEM